MNQKIDWSTKEKMIADINEWRNKFYDIRELAVSQDGEVIGAVVQTSPETFTLCINGQVWEEEVDRIRCLTFNAKNEPVCLVVKEFQWTVKVGDNLWENTFDMMWNLTVSQDGNSVAVNVRTSELTSGVSLNDQPWEEMFPEVRDLVMSPDGKKVASHVQLTRRKELDIFWFYKKNFTVAINGKPWDNSFLVVWGATFSDDSNHVAATVMGSDVVHYTIAVDGKPWNKEFDGCWEPVFKPGSTDVVAPVLIGKDWTLALNSELIWPKFVQIFYPTFSPKGDKLAAVVAVEVGKWTVAVDGNPWQITFKQAVFDPIFSPTGDRIAAVAKENEKYTLVVDGKPWGDTFDNMWDPVFSPTGEHVALRAEKNGKYFIVVDGKIYNIPYDWLWDPIFSPDGSKILIRGIENGKYYRRIVSVSEIL